MQIWGKPALDPKNQILCLTDLSVAVESEAAFGLLGAAARAAMPYLQQALADFQQNKDGVQVEAAVRDLRLAGIEFDSTTLRVIAEADGTAKVAVTELPC